MAELERAGGCCSPAAEADCCEPSDKGTCCGDADCGCGEGTEQSADVREEVRVRCAAAAKGADTAGSTCREDAARADWHGRVVSRSSMIRASKPAGR